MNSQQLQLVNFEQAKRLKQLGFDRECLCRYNVRKTKSGEKVTLAKPPTVRNYIDWNNHWYNNKETFPNANSFLISAPTIALALKWFRDVKMIGCSVTQVILIGKKSKEYTFSYNKTYGCDYCTHDFDTYESAESALLDELLTLIEKENESI